MSYVPFSKYEGIRNDKTSQALQALDQRITDLEGACRVQIPVKYPDGSAYKRRPKCGLSMMPQYETRELRHVVRWLEEMLECTFQVIRTPDEEGGYDTAD